MCDLDQMRCVKEHPVTVGAEGEACDDLYAFCSPGLVCKDFGADDPGACGVPSGLNGNCDRNSQCQNGLYCSGQGICVSGKADGASCELPYECLSGICKYGADAGTRGSAAPPATSARSRSLREPAINR